jgi:hypothetical protein
MSHLLKGVVVFDIYDVLIQSTTSAAMQTDEETRRSTEGEMATGAMREFGTAPSHPFRL